MRMGGAARSILDGCKQCFEFTEVDQSSPPSGDPEIFSELTAPIRSQFQGLAPIH
jgi:hypothetical protein